MVNREGPYKRDYNSTNYSHPQDENLNNLHKSMEYNALGQPIVRISLGGTGGTANDAFGRLRTSQPYTLFDSFHRFQDNGKITVDTALGGTSTHDINSSSIVNSISGLAGSRVYRETSRVFAYQPGKSLQILLTFCMNSPKAGLRQRIGYFDANNGIFLEQDGANIYLVKRSSSSGSMVETRVARSQWNQTPLDGTGVGTRTLDLSSVQIFFIDIEWLGVGSVRCGFVIDGAFIPVHQFNHANHGLTTTYMGTACLPLRMEIENVSATGSNSSFRNICASVISEGGYELQGRPRSIGHAINAPYRMATPGVLYPLVSIRLKENRPGAIAIPRNFSIGVTAASNFQYSLISGGITSGGAWNSAGTDSSVEYNLTAASISNGTILESSYIIASNQSAVAPSLAQTPFKYQLERNSFTNTRFEFIIAMTSTGNNQDVLASINWEEIT